MNNPFDALKTMGSSVGYSHTEIVFNMLLAVALGFAMAWVYRRTHKGLAYSQSFTLTILFVTLIVAMVMMVIGSNLARAFALVGALSIIRFRTVVKDTKDTAYVFAALALGMSAGTSNYFLAMVGTLAISILAITTNYFNFGALSKSEFVLRFVFDQREGNTAYRSVLANLTRNTQLLHMEPSADNQLVKLTYDVVMKNDVSPESLTASLGEVGGVSEVALIASRDGVDF